MRFDEAHQLFAQHFASELYDLSDLCVAGGEQFTHALQRFDADWENMQGGHNWAVTHRSKNKHADALCVDYANSASRSLYFDVTRTR